MTIKKEPITPTLQIPSKREKPPEKPAVKTPVKTTQPPHKETLPALHTIELQIKERQKEFSRGEIYWNALVEKVKPAFKQIPTLSQEEKKMRFSQYALTLSDMATRRNLSVLMLIDQLYFTPIKEKNRQTGRYEVADLKMTFMEKGNLSLFNAYRKEKEKDLEFISPISYKYGDDDTLTTDEYGKEKKLGRYCEAFCDVTKYIKLPDGSFKEKDYVCNARAYLNECKTKTFGWNYASKMLQKRAAAYLIDGSFPEAKIGILSAYEFDDNIELIEYEEVKEEVKKETPKQIKS